MGIERTKMEKTEKRGNQAKRRRKGDRMKGRGVRSYLLYVRLLWLIMKLLCYVDGGLQTRRNGASKQELNERTNEGERKTKRGKANKARTQKGHERMGEQRNEGTTPSKNMGGMGREKKSMTRNKGRTPPPRS